MTVPRTLSLRRTPDGLHLVQTPVLELQKLHKPAPLRFAGGTFDDAAKWLAAQKNLPVLLEIEMVFTGVAGKAPFTILLHTGKDQRTALICDPSRERLIVDRSLSGKTSFHKTFPGSHEGRLRLDAERVSIRLLLDTSSLEVFAQGGETSLTELIFPAGGPRQISLASDGVTPSVGGIVIHELEAAP